MDTYINLLLNATNGEYFPEVVNGERRINVSFENEYMEISYDKKVILSSIKETETLEKVISHLIFLGIKSLIKK